ncbi:AAA family ATPase [Patulibacter sp.]|uniref:AAA family ATPase n=1 Tax=Patulibacter sp. TaxID=1912859 RepID=UPI00271A7FFC|nr:AAA family ATPase [Patulibacter sp.]MDO9409689.1 AAA family ATPase [Patulibacter sp.]
MIRQFSDYMAGLRDDDARAAIMRKVKARVNVKDSANGGPPAPVLLSAEDKAVQDAEHRTHAETVVSNLYGHARDRLAGDDSDAKKARAHAASVLLADHGLPLSQPDAEALVKRVAAAPQHGAMLGTLAGDLRRAAPEDHDWIVPGVAAHGWTVKFAAREKTGKGTLIAHLLGKVERGESTVFGPATRPTTALIYTEEPSDSMGEKLAASGLEKARVVFGWELAKLGLDWRGKADVLVATAEAEGHEIVFVDNISRAAGIEEESGTELARAAEYLSDACKAAGKSLWLDHHHRKGAGSLEDKSRGGTAMAGAMDNNVEMERLGGWESRVRRLSSRGRVSASVWTQTITLDDDGRGYTLVADDTQPQTGTERKRLGVLNRHDAGLTTREFETEAEVSNETARTTLDGFVAQGWARKDDSTRPARWYPTEKGRYSVDPPKVLEV